MKRRQEGRAGKKEVGGKWEEEGEEKKREEKAIGKLNRKVV